MLNYKSLLIFNLFSHCIVNSLAITYNSKSTFDSYVIYDIGNPILLIFFAALGATLGQIFNILSGYYLTIIRNNNHFNKFQIITFEKNNYFYCSLFLCLMLIGWIGSLIVFISPYFIKMRIKIFIFSVVLGNVLSYIIRWQKIKAALIF
ncbi:putative DedA family protein [Candidatus Xenohaliotis californiensis]|uniref:DedA family protein n=1 Tax=Candidatus Xenohaliotis californiensis TaxID=84677 RepID=A0ABP0ERG0_9RICK|nr:putative DedA family protein [Candidatus Xenohaliotis californiensis]